MAPMINLLEMLVELSREEDGRWIGEVPSLPGVLAYGESQEDAVRRVEALALRVLADKIEHGEVSAEFRRSFFEQRIAAAY